MFVNGISYGLKRTDNFRADFNIGFRDGENNIEVRGYKNGKEIKDFKSIVFEMQPFNFSDSKFKFKEININCGGHYFYLDNERQLWYPDKEYEKGNYGYIGGKKYMFSNWNGSNPAIDRDIKGTEEDRIFQSRRDSIVEYKFDLPDGTYEINLGFAELHTKNELMNANKTGINNYSIERVFDVDINNRRVIEELNLLSQYGEYQKVEKKFLITTNASEGISIKFTPQKGTTVVNCIGIRKVW
jgi:beta-galactosidase